MVGQGPLPVIPKRSEESHDPAGSEPVYVTLLLWMVALPEAFSPGLALTSGLVILVGPCIIGVANACREFA